MTSDRWVEIERIFHAARACDGAARAALLDAQCQGDADLRREVQSLLDACRTADGFLERPALEEAARQLADATQLLPGHRRGQYELVSLLGSGGMGEVWRARDTLLGREVAIKVLPSVHSQDADRMRRFEQEARAAGALNHPNIVVVYAIANERGSPYLVTELLEGQTLRERLKAGPLPRRQAIECAIQIAQGLAAAHEKSIVHRDLKPENLFLTRDERLKILDFGLAKLMEPRAGMHAGTKTISGAVLGTVGYMSPEQAAGMTADARSDVFSFGLVFYELLTGTPAAGNLLEIPGDPLLETICRRCTEARPDDRFRSARDLAFALEAALAGQAHPRAKRRWAERGRMWPFAACGFLVGILAGVALAWFLLPGRSESPSFAYLTYSGRDFAPAAAPDGRTIAFSSDRDGTPKIWLKQVADGSEVAITTGPDFSPRFSPDGAAILFIRNPGHRASLFKLAAVGGEPRRLLDDVVDADFSPDGKKIAFIRWHVTPTVRSAVGVMRGDGSEPTVLAEVPGRHLMMPRWSPDGKRIASIDSIAGFGTDIHITTQEGNWSVLDPKTELSISGVAWLASGDELVYVRGDYAASGRCELVRQRPGSDRVTLLPWPHRSRSIDILADGKIVFDTSSRRSNLREIPLVRGTPRWLTRGIAMDRQPVFSPDGEQILFTSDRSGNTDIWQMDLRSARIVRIVDHPADDMDPAYAAGGNGVIWTSNRSGHLEIYLAEHDGSQPRRVTDDGVDAQNATATPDGQWVVYTSSHPEKRGIWKIRPDGSGAALIVRGTNFNPEVSPDGKYVLYVTSPSPTRNVIRVARIEDGSDQRVEIVSEIRKPTQVVLGRARWLPDGGAIVYIGQDENGVHGVYQQAFSPGKHSAAPRKLAAFDADLATESLSLSPDGKRLVIASWDQLWSLVLAERVPGIVRPR